MFKGQKNMLKLACIYIGTIIGAGFASGQEIIEFFVEYGVLGFFGLLISMILFMLVGWAILDISYRKKTTSFSEFLEVLFGKTLGKINEYIALLFLMLMYSTMLAGGGAAISAFFGISAKTGALIIAALSFFVFMYDAEGIAKVNVILCPLLILGIIIIALYIFLGNPTLKIENFYIVKPKGAFVSAFVYVSYNIITAVSVLVGVSSIISNRRDAFMGGMLGGAFMGIISFVIAFILAKNFEIIQYAEVPMLALTASKNKILEAVYVFIFLSAVFTTAVGNGFGIIKWMNFEGKFMRRLSVFLVCVLGFLLSEIGFSDMVGKIYPLFGYIGLLELIVILLNIKFRIK